MSDAQTLVVVLGLAAVAICAIAAAAKVAIAGYRLEEVYDESADDRKRIAESWLADRGIFVDLNDDEIDLFYEASQLEDEEDEDEMEEQ